MPGQSGKRKKKKKPTNANSVNDANNSTQERPIRSAPSSVAEAVSYLAITIRVLVF